MKIIGIVSERGDPVYIAQIEHGEIEQFLDLYYGKLPRLQVSQEIDLGKGCKFHSKTVKALKETQNFIQANKSVIDTIFTGISIMGNNGWKTEELKEGEA